MNAIAVLFLVMPLLALLLLPLVHGRGGQYVLAWLALVPGAVLLTGVSLPLPWIMLGSALSPDFPVAAAIVLQCVLFALALLPGAGPGSRPRAESASLLLAHGGLLAALLAVDVLLLLTGLTVASYALLAARLCIVRPAPARLTAVAVFLAAGDLAAFELGLLLAKAAGNAVVPAMAGVAGAIDASAFIAAFAVAVAISRGALLLIVGRRLGDVLPLLALLFLAVPFLAWRLQGSYGVLAAAAGVATGAILALGLARLLARAGPLLRALAQRLDAPRERSLPRLPAGAPLALGRAELLLGSWGAALGTTVFLIMLVFLATRGGGS